MLVIPAIVLGQKEYSNEAKSAFEAANAAYKKGQNEQAFTLYQKCVSLEPKFVEALVNMSVIKFEDKAYESSLEYAQKAYAIEKVQESIFVQLGKSYYMTEGYDSAMFFLERINVFRKLSEHENYFLAASKVKLSDFVGARPIAEKLRQDNPENSDYVALEGNVYYGLGEYERAMKDYEHALSLDANNIYIYSNIANAYLALDKPEQALEYIDKGINTATGKEKVSFLILKGNYFHSIGELDNAEKAYDDAYALDNNNANILVNQAGILIDRNDFQGAFEKCNAAISMNDQLMEAYFNRGIANEMLKNVQGACEDWEQAFIMGSEKAEQFLNSSTCNE